MTGPTSTLAAIAGRTLLSDNYATGFRSWVPLVGGAANQAYGMGGFDGSALVLLTEDKKSYGDNSAIFFASAWLSRLTMPPEPRIYLSWEWGLRVYHDDALTRGPSFGLDVDDGGDPGNFAPAHGRRHVLMNQCLMYDEVNNTYYGGKWQYSTASTSAYTRGDLLDFEGDLISPFKYPRLGVGQNYGKVLRQYTEQVLNVQTWKFEGLRHNGVGFGVLPSGGGYDPNLATNPRANELVGNVAASGTDDGFVNGCNLYVQLDNRADQPSKGTLYVYACTAVAFS